MWYLLFVVGGPWFIGLCILTLLCMFWFVEHEAPGKAFFTLAAYFGALYFFGDFNVIDWVTTNWVVALIATVAFFVVGTLWSVGKWWLFVHNRKDEFFELKKIFIQRNNLDVSYKEPIPDGHLSSFDDFVASQRLFKGPIIPNVLDQKSRILIWMMYWPWSMVWTLINDPIKKMFKAIYAKIERLYEKIANSVLGDAAEELKAAKTAKKAKERAEQDELDRRAAELEKQMANEIYESEKKMNDYEDSFDDETTIYNGDDLKSE